MKTKWLVYAAIAVAVVWYVHNNPNDFGVTSPGW
jgi:hypothetical protein